LTGLLALNGFAPGAVLAEEPVPAASPTLPEGVHNWETGANKSYLIPALEIPGFLTILNVYDRFRYGNDVYGTTVDTTWKHIRQENWQYDQDPFKVNQLFHPYQGSMFHGFARSAGLGFWTAWFYDNVGSYLWKMGGETGEPSLNDQITTGQAGSFFGEALFRMANLLLEGGGEHPGAGREWAAAVVSPPTALNRLVFGDRFKTLFPSHDPATFLRLRLGTTITSNISELGTSNAYTREKATADLSLEYGLPGKPGYTYDRPFDYFDFQITAHANSTDPFEDVMVRGLLYGKKYEAGDNYRGIWGLYGSYDYISPEIFRVSSTAASLGTTAQWWLSPAVALQGSALGGLGFGAAGAAASTTERDYHYGATPQGLFALRMIFGNMAMLDAAAREYFVAPRYFSGLGTTDAKGSEQIARVNTSFTLHLWGPHAIGIQYVITRRDAYYPDIADRHQTIGTVSFAYNYLFGSHFGATEWRAIEDRER